VSSALLGKLANDRIIVFIFLAIYCGGIFPIATCVGVQQMEWWSIIPEFSFKNFIVLLFVFIILASGLTWWRILRTEQGSSSELPMTILALLSIFFLHFFVAFSGGSIGSVFSIHYLYILTAVSITFKDKFTLIVTAAGLIASFTINLFPWTKYVPTWMYFHDYSGHWAINGFAGRSAYLFVFLVQVGIAIWLNLRMSYIERNPGGAAVTTAS
jgi:hypothetical protein